jgi:hypothetical protein
VKIFHYFENIFFGIPEMGIWVGMCSAGSREHEAALATIKPPRRWGTQISEMGHPPRCLSLSFGFRVPNPNIIVDYEPNFIPLYPDRIARMI